ncbi:hypothetical protein K2173_016080 [Erythroxylum novogranatense]|uniref:C3H1-type domain-containing protein n=1 Tax=Erythroxylum novogranatense TaxID=1862640 RepID=A0AAV8SFU8_9ROSI|nr:hypothetical protein K2173_016080 [Erythroxylum novogranatense]
MMLGERHRPNPTVHVPPWTLVDDSNPEFYTSDSGNVSAVSDYSPYYLQEALAALQCYLPSNDPELDSESEISVLEPDSPVDSYSCDQFRMFEFKVRRCARGRSHDWTECPYAHPGEKARRRDPRKYHYSGTACPEFREGNCRKGDACEFAHGVFECWLHPARYRTQPCKDGQNCRRRVCFFAHTPEQLRVLPQQSPKSLNSPESYDGSPLRQAIEASCAKSLSFLSSPLSISPPTTPSGDSPPMSPMTQTLSRSLGSTSINEMVASLRNLQLGKVKSFPPSWNMQVGRSVGSPRGSMLRPGFSSVPTTPTRVTTRSGPAYADFWDKACEEEPAMERVESGRDLRAKMFEKLSKENSLGRTDPKQTRCTGTPDVEWVSDLVQ